MKESNKRESRPNEKSSKGFSFFSEGKSNVEPRSVEESCHSSVIYRYPTIVKVQIAHNSINYTTIEMSKEKEEITWIILNTDVKKWITSIISIRDYRCKKKMLKNMFETVRNFWSQ